MERRRFLLALAAGLAGAAVGRGTVGQDRPVPVAAPAAPPLAAAAATTVEVPAALHLLPPAGVVQGLPGDGASLALTIDDGTSTEVVAAFATFAADSGVRLTFFPNGCYRSWEDNAGRLRPLVESGQVAMGNHTWSHPDLRTLGDREVAEEIGRNRDFLRSVFGIRDSPFFRPPFGSRNERIDRIAADQGHPTVVMWDGTLEDSRVLTAEQLMAAARQWCTAQRIVVGHANHPTVTTVYGDLLALIAERGLRTVTLADVWATPAQRLRGSVATGRAATS
ncbi:peptidoglycan/xylan/chitin deacetylase (PgdA/CDA1 family) [Blastococcus colisei]|uniref:Peptidoglycan/xylan/chitin deacetylase (PgdA/CDA1 family) n=1 Tax=Blastococcus colisei TaxID=1564162 RepID=A0A543PJE8_9ACTN|nr:polysaccharide deacetylase family protein [Blastococcus colisei]TQN44202.1 peptidoglycan/xylan/chitin deacetylase (PgdA/CDA1 family) [Blastococcus colisei]